MVVRQQRVLGLRSDVYLSSLDPDRNMEFHRAHLNTGTMQLLVIGGKIHFSKKKSSEHAGQRTARVVVRSVVRRRKNSFSVPRQ